MSDEEENGENKEYEIKKSQTTSIQDSKEVHVKAPSKEEAKDMFKETWDDD